MSAGVGNRGKFPGNQGSRHGRPRVKPGDGHDDQSGTREFALVTCLWEFGITT